MKKTFIVFLLLLVAVSLFAQTRYQSPQTATVDPPAEVVDGYHWAVQLWDEATLFTTIEFTTSETQLIDLEARGLSGIYRVMVRSYIDIITPTGTEREFSEWLSSTVVADCLNGETFYIEYFAPVEKPSAMRIP